MGLSPRAESSPVDRRRCAAWPALTLGVLMLASCATPRKPVQVPPYVAPAGVATARLLSRGTVAAGDVYGVVVYDDAASCAGPRLAGAGNSTRSPKATEIEAGRIATLDFLAVRADRSACRVRWSFTPTAGKTYLIAGALSGTSCNARLLDATDPDRMRPESTAQRRNVGGNACNALVARPPSSTVGGSEQTGEAVLRPGASADDLQGLIQP
jgi:hypothetical protein